MSFRYVNPGYGGLLSPYDSSYPLITVQSDVYNPINGLAFSQAGSYCDIKLDEPIGTDLYGYFDLCSPSGNISSFYFGSFTNNTTSFGRFYGIYGSSRTLCAFCDTNYLTNLQISANKVHSIWFHLYNCGIYSKDNYDSFIEIILDQDNKYSRNLNSVYPFNSDYKAVTIRFGKDMYISNLIVSNEYISPKEKVIILPTNGVETNMKNNQDGSYTAEEEGQTLFQTVDASNLITQFGSTSKITSLVSAAIPAYKTDEGLAYLVGVDKISGELIQHNPKAVSTSSDTGICDCWTVNMSLAQLNGKQIGLKAAT